MAIVTVIGATGRQGMAQIRQLLAAGHTPRAVSRRENPFAGTPFETVETVTASLADDASMTRAFQGADFVFHTQPYLDITPRSEILTRLGQLAARENVKRFVWNTSCWIPERGPGDYGIYSANTEGLNALFRSGVPATVLGPILFMDNLLTDWARPFIVNEDRYVYPHQPHLAANWISLDDVAKCMIACLDRPDLEGSWLNLGGPERIEPPKVAEILSETLGRPIKYDPCTPEEFGEYLVSAFAKSGDVPEAYADAYKARVAEFYAFNNSSPLKPFEVDIDFQMNRLPVELETLSQWCARQDWTASTEVLRAPAG